MRVILSAFGNALWSKEKEWPDSTGDRIYMIMDMDRMSGVDINGVPKNIPVIKKATFQWFGKTWGLDKNPARVYKLVDVS